jgi:hypothetical protein
MPSKALVSKLPAAIAVLLIAGCSSTVGSSVGSPAATTDPVSPSMSVPAAQSALEGLWKTKPVSREAIVAALQAANQQQWIQPLLANGGIGATNVFTLRITDGHWTQYWSKDGGADDENDDGAYQISGSHVTVQHSGTSTDVFGWSVQGNALTFTVVGDTFPPSAIPEAVTMTAFYAAAPYIRQP